MDWDGLDLREFERIEGHFIPECFKNFIIEQGTGNKIKAETTDFTIKGIRLLIPIPLENIQAGDGLIIYPLDESFKLIGEIIYIISLDDDTLYAGIRFLRTKSLDNYIRIIEETDLKPQRSVRF
ncbi:MAG: hypothetical protein JXB88_23560 [Spirochaetales bacterium]|nr:hypothetical protein [Spirochaetales bacterium]